MWYGLRRLAGVLGVGMMVAGSAAAQVTYTCELTSPQRKAWIPDILFIGHDAEKGRVVISDPIVLHFNDRRPIEGRVSIDNAKRITFAWNYTATDSKGKRAKMLFRATWLKADQEMRITAMPAGYHTGFNGVGTCDRQQR
ncbi:hypothetical protein MWU54_12715 [Marivita sp. S6314]|uniref:hypothetical protein n=1 Tax=Marivita sp. S6314 TaxID=2926406 RepID=UPI001FF41BDE|nr:hypothetical protein [Marivita sp. S6314]MCK0150894.1 hypothetical protein [Marivita sp. S6314]